MGTKTKWRKRLDLCNNGTFQQPHLSFSPESEEKPCIAKDVSYKRIRKVIRELSNEDLSIELD